MLYLQGQPRSAAETGTCYTRRRSSELPHTTTDGNEHIAAASLAIALQACDQSHYSFVVEPQRSTCVATRRRRPT